MNNNIKLCPEAEQAIEALRHSAGTHEVYRNTLTRIFNHVLHAAEDLGMDDLEALETLRALDMIRRDLAALATTPAEDNEADEETDDKDDIDFALTEAIRKQSDIPGDQLDEPREMLDDVNRGFFALQRATEIIEEAALRASHADEKYRAVCEDLNDICENLSLQGARLDAIMAIDPETFEPTPVTDDSKITDEKPNVEKGGDE